MAYFKTKSAPTWGPRADFPARVPDKVKLVDHGTGSAAGAVKQNKTGDWTVFVPNGRTAFDRMIRLHEADHIRYTQRVSAKTPWVKECAVANDDEKGSMQNSIAQAVKDVEICAHPVWARRPTSVCRDALAVGLRECRTLTRRMEAIKVSERLSDAQKRITANYALCELVRGMALVVTASVVLDKPMDRDDIAKVCRMSPENGTIKRLYAAVERASDNGRCAERIRAALLPLLPPEPSKDMPGHIPANDEGKKTPARGYAGSSVVGNKPKIIDNDALRTVPCDNRIVAPLEQSAPSGYRVNPRSLVPMALGIPGSHFIRRQTQEQRQGTILIDASGSMGMDNEQLEALCQSAPAATVAYYSGQDAGDGKGTLVVYARDGHRLPTIIERNGGNDVDLNAVRWILAQPGPWIFMTDEGYCGDTQQAISETMALVASHPITLVPDVESAQEAFAALADA